MKKILLSLMAVAGIAATASAQLTDGTVFPDFTLTDIHGNVHHLYDDLNAGKTVFIDISATWCNPCWNYHNSGALDTLYAKHGPLGQPGVYSTSTNDVVVLFVQGEPTSHLAELYNTAGATAGSASVETPYATSSQGDWTAHTGYPIIDDTTSSDPVVGTQALDNAWQIAFFPTVYMICRDHLVHSLEQPTAAQAYAAVASGCPATPPATGTSLDAKAIAYTGSGYFVCTATPTLSFLNYSTSPITSATITVKDGTGTVVGTQAWTGSVASLDYQNVAFTTPITGTSFSGYTFSVSVPGDINPANDAFTGSTFSIYDAANAQAIPYTEDFSASATLSDKYIFLEPNGFATVASAMNNPSSPGSSLDVTGPSGSSPDTVLLLDDYDASHNTAASVNHNYAIPFLYGNYNTTGLTHETLQFDVAYAARTGAPATDSLKVLVSTDCGGSYQTAWAVGGAALKTAPDVATNWFVPTAATQWKHMSAPIGAYANSNLMIAIEGKNPATASTGMSIYLDNIKFANSTAVAQVNLEDNVAIYPNPARDMANLNFNLSDEATIQVEVSDVMGRIVSTISQHVNAGTDKIEVPTASLAAGVYNVKITNGESVTVKKLSVVK